MINFKKYGKLAFEGLAVASVGVTGVNVAGVSTVGNEVAIVLSGVVTGVVTIASILSSWFKDKNPKPFITFIMKVVNFFAVNFDKAENDKKINSIEKINGIKKTKKTKKK